MASQPVRFLVVGGLNTAWGYGCFAALYYLLSPYMHYLVILTAVNVINVTVSYLTQKFFVFRTKGNYLGEYLRFYAVNAVPIALGYLLFPVLVSALRMNAYLAQAMIITVSVVISYFGHKHVSFSRPRQAAVQVTARRN